MMHQRTMDLVSIIIGKHATSINFEHKDELIMVFGNKDELRIRFQALSEKKLGLSEDDKSLHPSFSVYLNNKLVSRAVMKDFVKK